MAGPVVRTARSGRAPVRVLDDRDYADVLALLDTDPVGNVLVASRVLASGCDPWRLGAQLWAYPGVGRARALCYAGANLIPIVAPGDAEALDAFAERARWHGRRCSSIVGHATAVLSLWERLEPHWGAAREVRPTQPLLAITEPSPVAPDPEVRRVRPEEIDILLPACVSMFTEEVGVSPLADGGLAYGHRVAELIAAGRAFARIDGGRVVFKAEVGAVSARACQVQGVWVDPAERGRGRSEPGMAAVVAMCLRDLAPVVSLYVNDFNVAARRSYERVGFRQVATFASVLF